MFGSWIVFIKILTDLDLEVWYVQVRKFFKFPLEKCCNTSHGISVRYCIWNTVKVCNLASLLPWGWLEHLVETLASFTEKNLHFIHADCNWERCHFRMLCVARYIRYIICMHARGLGLEALSVLKARFWTLSARPTNGLLSRISLVVAVN